MPSPARMLPLVLASVLPLMLSAQTAAPQSTNEPQMPGHMEQPPVPPSRSLSINYAGHTTVLTIDDLLAMPQTTVHVHNAHRNTDEDYAGPLLSAVLEKAGLVVSKETEPIVLHSALVARGTDGYFVLYSAAEATPSFSKGKVIVAVTKGGQPDTEGGRIQLINTDDAKPARWVHGLYGLFVMNLSPPRQAGSQPWPAAQPTAPPP